jgi:hydroxymethylbilane synthase
MMVKIGTRGSHLARTQAATIAAALAGCGVETTLVIIRTAGDLSDAPSFGSIGPQGVFVREIEQALLDGRVDIAVHSYKDLPTESPPALCIAAVPRRLDAADVLIAVPEATDTGAAVLPLRAGARIGTASARRQAWIRHLRPDLRVEPLRGNVPTRIAKVGAGLDAVVLAAAGVERLLASTLDDKPALGLGGRAMTALAPRAFPPAPAQGALALQCRRDDAATRERLRPFDDAATRACVDAERALLARIEGGCDLALGAYCAAGAAGGFDFLAMLEHGGELRRATASGAEPAALVEPVWRELGLG